MPPRTGPRSRRRPRTGAPRHFLIIGTDTVDDLVVAHRIELDDGNLVLRDQHDAISRIVASGEWREIRPATIGDIPYADEADNAPGSGADSDRIDSMQREEATLTPPPAAPPPRTVEFDTVRAPIREEAERFMPSSPEEAQRMLMELHRRLAPDYQDPPDCADVPPPPPIRKD